MEKKRIKLEEENEDLRQRLIESELAKQVLRNEMDKLREVSVSLGVPGFMLVFQFSLKELRVLTVQQAYEVGQTEWD